LKLSALRILNIVSALNYRSPRPAAIRTSAREEDQGKLGAAP
jgi:hypothetical protein